MIGHPVLRLHRPEATFAWRDGNPISAARFLSDVAALARLLPAHRYVVNLCADRYSFTVGFAAALCRNQINLLPPHGAPELLKQLTEDYPDIYCLTDGSPPEHGISAFGFPARLGDDRAGAENPVIAADQPAAVLFTSGSTGRPRPHARSWGELVTSAIAEGVRLNLAALGRSALRHSTPGHPALNHPAPGESFLGRASLLGTVPHQHSYGLESLVMLALQHGLTLHAARLFYPADIRAQIAATPRPRMLVTTPVHLRVLLAEAETPPPVDLVLCATAPLAGQLARQAEARFAGRLYEIYGCSEAGQIAARRTAVTEEWRCLDGITLRHDAAGIWASGAPIAVETLLPDVIELRDPERFLLHGRIADLVDVAGKRTSLAHLNYHLNAIDGVQDGAFAIADSAEQTTVSRLAAFVVAPGRSAGDILAELRRRIDVAFLPRPLCLVPELPRNALGKLPFDEIQRLIATARRQPVMIGPDPVYSLSTTQEPTPGPAPDHAAAEVPTDRKQPGSARLITLGTMPGQMPGSTPAPDAAGIATDDPADAGVDGSDRRASGLCGSATRYFAVGHTAAEGHFPGNPIIPGAVLLREVVAAIFDPDIAPATPREILWTKFHRPVRPGTTVELTWQTTGDEVRFAGSIAGADRPAITGALRLPPP